MHNSVNYTHQGTLPRNVEKALSNLRRCGCCETWKRYTQLTVDGRINDLEVMRYRLCIGEQCGQPGM